MLPGDVQNDFSSNFFVATTYMRPAIELPRILTFRLGNSFIIAKIKKLYYNILTERDKEDLKMFDDFDTMIQSDELAVLYFFEEDYDGQEDI